MANKSRVEDPGIGQKYQQRTKRIINKDGSFNVTRKGTKGSVHRAYQFLIGTNWVNFFCLLFVAYLLLNTMFAALYLLAGLESLSLALPVEGWEAFAEAFHFSAQTLTTVGYGAVAPEGNAVKWISSFEAFLGLISFAFATGLLYGRFDRPKPLIKYSNKAILSTESGNRSLKFRVVNQRNNVLINVGAKVLLVLVDKKSAHFSRSYYNLDLVVSNINFMPLNWTVVHGIDEESPLHQLSVQDLQEQEAEILILVSAYDDTYRSTIHSRFSYRFDELVYDKEFTFPYYVDSEGEIIMDIEQMNELQDKEAK